ncbi:DMT family transporter [Anaeromyxobacter paludicola]|uniref:EamA domain-containing protein n=1 Tax=Anaeromyxobacter paludicola TaxID=2918171 RepID=A0ABM7XFJ2_9BACT|nr:DMT family transporter [Anaeromyxobacter paludicola]BDG10670.1 hypothetical protein AMPC_37830 [Anaeromyxobacter paludicola]
MSRPSQRPLGLALTAAAATLWGCWALFLRPSGLGGAQVALLVLATMSLPAPFAFRREALRDRGATLALAGLALADVGNMALYFAALQRGPLAVAVLTHYLAPVAVAVLSPLLFRERHSARALAAAPASLAGLALLVWRPGAAGFPLATALLGAGSAVFYAAIVLCAKRAGRSYGPTAITALHAPLSAAGLLALHGRAALPGALGPALPVLAGGLVCGLGASVLFYAGLRRIPAEVAGALTYLEPLTATLIGAALLGERLDLAAWAGAALILACGLWVALERRGEPLSPRRRCGAAGP